VHGTGILAAALTAFAGVAAIARDRRVSLRSLAFVVAPWACVLASPYALELPGYYRVMLLDPPFGRLIVEWQWARPSGATAAFYALVAATALLIWRSWGRLNGYELVVLGVLLVEAVNAVRAIALFVIAAQVLLPSSLDRVLDRQQKSTARLGRPLAIAACTGVAASLIVAIGRSDGWYQRYWPEDAIVAIAREPSSTPVFPSDRTADWVLWRIPSLRGRIAYDVRFEILERREIAALYRYSKMRGPAWQQVTDPYGVIVFDLPRRKKQLKAFLSQGNMRVAYEKKNEIAVVVRT
jgi:hypothetical protein